LNGAIAGIGDAHGRFLEARVELDLSGDGFHFAWNHSVRPQGIG
jgi:hypothetical protein